MRRALLASGLVVAAAVGSPAANADYGMPSGTFSCTVLMADRLTGTDEDQFVPSVLGTTTLDGSGDYVRREGGSGSVVAVHKRVPRGRAYLHIDGQVDVPPSGDPKPADFVCYQQ